MAKRDPSNQHTFVIVGGGPAGQTCAETLRQSDFTGRIVIISAEDLPAYDRTLLTKVLPKGDATKWQLRSNEFNTEHNLEYQLGKKVTKVDTKNKIVTLSDGTSIVNSVSVINLFQNYDKLLIATGGKARKPNIKGIDFSNVFALRDHKD